MAPIIPIVPKEFTALYGRLLRTALRRGVFHEDAEEIVNDVLLKAITAFDPARGQFEPFCKTILQNRISNHFRDRKRHLEKHQVDLVGNETVKLATPPHKIPELEEAMRQTRKVIDKIFGLLTKQERQFLLTLEEVLAEQEKSTVSEPARKLGLTPLEGWNVMRRIQRKAERFRTEVQALESALSEHEGEWQWLVVSKAARRREEVGPYQGEAELWRYEPSQSYLLQLARLENGLHRLSAEAAFHRWDDNQRRIASQLFR